MDGDETAAFSSPSPASSLLRSDPCPICLCPVIQEAYLDECFHKFCYRCILQWMKIVNGRSSSQNSTLKCPLCKRENFCIIHSYDGDSFKKHYVNGDRDDGSHKYRLQCYYSEPGTLNDVFNVSRFWKFKKYCQTSRWLEGWMRREIQALLQEEDVDIIVHHILGLIDSFSKSKEPKSGTAQTPESIQTEFKMLVSNAASCFLTARTERFINELELFLASGLNIQAYDEVYIQHTNPKPVKATSHETGDDPGGSTASVPFLHVFDEDSDELE